MACIEFIANLQYNDIQKIPDTPKYCLWARIAGCAIFIYVMIFLI